MLNKIVSIFKSIFKPKVVAKIVDKPKVKVRTKRDNVLKTLKVVLRAEEGFTPKAYIPTRGGKAIGKSGVTIGQGFDIGQFSSSELKRMGIGGSLLNKISPYLGITGTVAQRKLRAAPLELSLEEVETLDNAVLASKYKTINNIVSGIEKQSGRKLSKDQQVALGSMAFQGITPSSFPNSFKAFIAGDLEAARKGFLNSKWARKQTPERAQRTVKALIDNISLTKAEAALVTAGIISKDKRTYI